MTDADILKQWFDLSKPIPQHQLEACLEQMFLYAIKDGFDPESPEAEQEYKAMRNLVKRHNKAFKSK